MEFWYLVLAIIVVLFYRFFFATQNKKMASKHKNTLIDVKELDELLPAITLTAPSPVNNHLTPVDEDDAKNQQEQQQSPAAKNYMSETSKVRTQHCWRRDLEDYFEETMNPSMPSISQIIHEIPQSIRFMKNYYIQEWWNGRVTTFDPFYHNVTTPNLKVRTFFFR